MADKIKILWICDVKGWAFYNRSKQLINLLPEYSHKIFYYNPEDHETMLNTINNYDIIISWGVSMISFKHIDKTIIGLTGGRIQNNALTRLLNNTGI